MVPAAVCILVVFAALSQVILLLYHFVRLLSYVLPCKCFMQDLSLKVLRRRRRRRTRRRTKTKNKKNNNEKIFIQDNCISFRKKLLSMQVLLLAVYRRRGSSCFTGTLMNYIAVTKVLRRNPSGN